MSTEGHFEQLLREMGTLIYPNKGISMRPLIREGKDAMILEAIGDRTPKKYDCIMFRSGDRYLMHRVIRVTENGYVTRGDNCLRSEYVKPEDTLAIMTGLNRGGKKVSPGFLTAFGKVWCWIFPLRCLPLAIYATYVKSRKMIRKIIRKR